MLTIIDKSNALYEKWPTIRILSPRIKSGEKNGRDTGIDTNIYFKARCPSRT